LPKGTLVGARVTAEAVPVPVSGTVCGLAGASSATLMFADLAPVAVGLKVTPTAQLELTVNEFAPNAQAVPVVGAPSVKSPVFVPVSVILVMFSVAVPLFVMVTLAVALVVPVRWLPNGTLTGANVTADAVPVPVRGTVCGLPEALSATLTLADRAPVAAGLNVIPTAQFDPAFNELAPNAHAVPVVGAPRLKSPGLVPVSVMPVMFSVAVPLFVMVKFVTELLVPVR